MAGPKEEWLIWDRRFQFGYSCLNQRLKNNEEATQQIAQLEQKIQHLATSSKHLEEANDSLRDRIQKLEQASCQFTPFDKQLQDLTASSQNLKEENNVLNDKILQLENESTHRDQQNRLVQKQLNGKLGVQEEDFKSVAAALRGMHEIDMAARAQRAEEIRHLRSQVEALIATGHTLGAHAQDGESGGEGTVCRRVSNVWRSVQKHLPGHYTRREDAGHSASPRRSPRHRGPGHAHKGSSSLHAV